MSGLWGEPAHRRAAYLGGTPTTHPIASPLHADFARTAPLIIHASDSEIVRDDSVRFAAKAAAAGWRCKLRSGRDCRTSGRDLSPTIPEAVIAG